MTEQRKRSDTSLINFMHNHKVSVKYDGIQWVATTEHVQGYGDTVRLALSNLVNKAKGAE